MYTVYSLEMWSYIWRQNKAAWLEQVRTTNLQVSFNTAPLLARSKRLISYPL